MKPRLQDVRLFSAELRLRAGTASTPDDRDLFDAAAEAMRDKAERMNLEDECEQEHAALSMGGALFCQVCGADLRNG